MTRNRGYEGASVPAGNPLEPAPPGTAELRVLEWVADTPLPTVTEWITTHIPRSIIEDARAVLEARRDNT